MTPWQAAKTLQPLSLDKANEIQRALSFSQTQMAEMIHKQNPEQPTLSLQHHVNALGACSMVTS